MTGPEHYREAERIIASAPSCNCEMTGCKHEKILRSPEFLARAQVHATLALAAATALANITEAGLTSADRTAWIAAASEHPGQQKRFREAEAAELAELADGG